MSATRFAPSPTGYLHKGHAFSALRAFETARRLGGRFVLRIEDIDHTRCRPQFEAAIYDDLAWLGLQWETPVLRQSEHREDYLDALDRLRAAGLVYRCFATRKAIAEAMLSAPHGPLEGYRGAPLSDREEAARLAAGEPFAWRLNLAAALAASGALTFDEAGDGSGGECGRIAVGPAAAGDVVLARKDVGVAYHLAVVVDDARQGITDVVRGVDLFAATHVQRVLQALLGLPAPRYHHHRLIVGADGQRLAKRDRAETLRELRARGVTAEQLRRELGLDPPP
ncbi:MAG TPA: tRNA glutamyl-Q(34) synthetase GluQRS [Caulobacteraceae bacterium]|nr:tRNA glutamyl-Q(34) synthetase GluQRS [Caulobacteraceae bacterium]